MGLIIKLKKEGELRNHSFSIIVIEKKKNINSIYVDKIGLYTKLKNNLFIVHINKDKLFYWRNLGVRINKKVNKIIDILYV